MQKPSQVKHFVRGRAGDTSGRNRALAAREAGLEVVPATVMEDLDDEAALLVVMETNLVQR
jgi:hypothetical protein